MNKILAYYCFSTVSNKKFFQFVERFGVIKQNSFKRYYNYNLILDKQVDWCKLFVHVALSKNNKTEAVE